MFRIGFSEQLFLIMNRWNQMKRIYFPSDDYSANLIGVVSKAIQVEFYRALNVELNTFMLTNKSKKDIFIKKGFISKMRI